MTKSMSANTQAMVEAVGFDVADLIAGHLGCSRAHAYRIMQYALDARYPADDTGGNTVDDDCSK
jgi:hypothetical protein